MDVSQEAPSPAVVVRALVDALLEWDTLTKGNPAKRTLKLADLLVNTSVNLSDVSKILSKTGATAEMSMIGIEFQNKTHSREIVLKDMFCGVPRAVEAHWLTTLQRPPRSTNNGTSVPILTQPSSSTAATRYEVATASAASKSHEGPFAASFAGAATASAAENGVGRTTSPTAVTLTTPSSDATATAVTASTVTTVAAGSTLSAPITQLAANLPLPPPAAPPRPAEWTAQVPSSTSCKQCCVLRGIKRVDKQHLSRLQERIETLKCRYISWCPLLATPVVLTVHLISFSVMHTIQRR
jgi:hypothetical protein